jgi:hypothetical protein
MTETTVLEPGILTPDQITVPAITNADEIEALAQRYALEAQTDLNMAQAVQVTDDSSYEQAGALRVAIDKKRKGGEGVVEIVCGPLYTKWKRFRTLLMAPVDTRAQALKVLSDRRLAYERKKQEEAEAERQRLEEAARQEQARLDKLALERAQRAEARGDTAKAEEILATVPQIPIVLTPTEPVVPKTKGIAKNTYWFAEVDGCSGVPYVKAIKTPGPARDRIRRNFAALVTAVAAGEVPLEALLPNESWLGTTVKGLMENMKYSGVRVWSDERERSTGR